MDFLGGRRGTPHDVMQNPLPPEEGEGRVREEARGFAGLSAQSFTVRAF